MYCVRKCLMYTERNQNANKGIIHHVYVRSRKFIIPPNVRNNEAHYVN